ncbi:MBL fold metallo-hydrolase [Flavobacterium sinopsychrotolerans]|uniref:L-ascorbate metabolism protein UlaG, beta-lactamase superfamily n=1 Tax=Flavobacterium sinopsychrotolerans TaxID=604089 RepID=A0A1H8REX9_9FLAO|nr:MBL fold metallo-hydrolase [Flavobacterium sinopsychrotolerans]SEO64916.1 L-ascorbate metabolism protein UlaG, beta-lactamase superfamily [Flavobacterium sinopsychrotolerans]
MRKILLGVVLTLCSTVSFAQKNLSNKPHLQLVRNATLLIEYNGKKILVDPMLSPKGAIESWAGIQTNPTVDLKMPLNDIVKELDLVIVTHTHDDHFDKVASKILDKSIELINQPADKDFFQKEGFINANVLEDNKLWNGITIHRIEAEHGSGEVLKLMGKTSGFVLEAKNQPTLYIVGDAIWTDGIKKTIEKFKPDYIIVNSGGALIKGYEHLPIIMDEMQTMALVSHSGKAKVIAVHMDALDHCRTTRSSLRQKADEFKIGTDKLLIPKDGEIINLSL